jgi:hypothetical protein
VPTNIGFPDNAGIAVRTTGIAKFILRYVHTNGSRGNFNWVRSSAISPTALHISGGFRQPTFLCHNLCARNYLRNREDVKAWFHTRHGCSTVRKFLTRMPRMGEFLEFFAFIPYYSPHSIIRAIRVKTMQYVRKIVNGLCNEHATRGAPSFRWAGRCGGVVRRKVA